MGTNMVDMLFGAAMEPVDPWLRSKDLPVVGGVVPVLSPPHQKAVREEDRKKLAALPNPDVKLARLSSGKLQVTVTPEEAVGKHAKAYYENANVKPQTGGGGGPPMGSIALDDECGGVSDVEFNDFVEDIMRPGVYCMAGSVTIQPGHSMRVRTKLMRDFDLKLDGHTQDLITMYKIDEASVSMLADPIPFINLTESERLELQPTVTELTRDGEDVPCLLVNTGTFPITLVAGTKVARAVPIYTPKEVMEDPDWCKFVMNEKRDFRVEL
jgi:hypothetical protein